MDINEDLKDVITELTNIGVGDAASVLNEMVESHVTLQAPMLVILTPQELEARLQNDIGEDISLVQMHFNGGMNGVANLLFPIESGKKLTNLLSEGFEEEDYNSLKAGTLTEVGNIILNSVLASFSNALSEHLDYQLPEFSDLHVKQFIKNELFQGNDVSFLCEVNFAVQSASIEGHVVLVFDIDSLQAMNGKLPDLLM
jgi:chemotaxis protein CheC